MKLINDEKMIESKEVAEDECMQNMTVAAEQVDVMSETKWNQFCEWEKLDENRCQIFGCRCLI